MRYALAAAASLFLLSGIAMADDFRHIVNEVFMNMNASQVLDKEKMREEFLRHEGKRLTVYHDSLGFPTVGIGHLIKNTDILEVGDSVSIAHLERLFEHDYETHLKECKQIYPDFDSLPVKVREALLNMTFNMGAPKMQSFTNFNALIEKQDWGMVADYLRTNFKKWYAQVGNRAKEIEEKFRQAARGI
jgi:GH24 family phage-related lysozyme (muramidase)